jgi:hypothetical protein
MAPRGGGGHGGGGDGGEHHTAGSSGGYDGGDGPSNPSLWTQHMNLVGSHFKDPSTLAILIVSCLCLLALLGIAAWSTRIKTNGDPTRKIFKGLGLGLAISATWM